MLPDIRSAYRDNPGYGKALRAAVRQFKPKRMIEFGCGNGYTTCIISNALEADAHLQVYDTFEHRFWWRWQMWKVRGNVRRYGDGNIVSLARQDFWDWTAERCDLMYVDVGNDGDVIDSLAYSPFPVLFEGGIPERDQVPWMKNRPPICGTTLRYQVLYPSFPGLSLLTPRKP